MTKKRARFTYQQGDGIDQIHMNSDKAAGSTHPNLANQDGALVFYWKNFQGAPVARWIFIKFHTETLGASPAR